MTDQAAITTFTAGGRPLLGGLGVTPGGDLAIQHEGRWVSIGTWICVVSDDTVHAAPVEWGHRTDVDAAAVIQPPLCGDTGPCRFVANGQVVLTWPPRVSTLRADGLSRCRDCHEAAGSWRRPTWCWPREDAA